METLEFRSYTEEAHTLETVDRLKSALLKNLRRLQWESSDRQHFCVAHSVDEGDFPPESLLGMPDTEIKRILNTWHINRASRPGPDGSMDFEIFKLVAGQKMTVTHHEITPEMLDLYTDEQTLGAIEASADVQEQLGMVQPDLIDYANIDNALFDLERELMIHNHSS